MCSKQPKPKLKPTRNYRCKLIYRVSLRSTGNRQSARMAIGYRLSAIGKRARRLSHIFIVSQPVLGQAARSYT